MRKAKSGFGLKSDAGDIMYFTFAELIEIADEITIHPDFFLDVQSNMVFEFERASFSVQEYHETVRDYMIDRLDTEGAEKRYQLPADRTIEEISDHDLEKLAVAMFVRMLAADELQTKRWMQPILSRSMMNQNILPALGEYWCSASLAYSKKFGSLVYDEALARKAFRPLLLQKDEPW